MKNKQKMYKRTLVLMALFFYVNPMRVYAHIRLNTDVDQRHSEEELTINELKTEMIKEAIDILTMEDDSNIIDTLKEEFEDKLNSSETLEEVKQMSKNYEENNNTEEGIESDSRYVNDMLIKQEETTKEIQQIIDEARNNGEKLYTQEELLKLSAEEIGVNRNDLQQIKQSILEEIVDVAFIEKGMELIGEKEHQLVKNISEKRDTFKIPLSLVYIQRNDEEFTGVVSGGGWPYCLDDNGYGYKNFITSDCYKALAWHINCMADFTPWRYCKGYQKNCGGLIGHSKYWHTHTSWQKIP